MASSFPTRASQRDDRARTGERRLHLFGLLSDGGVHSQQNHLYALLRMAKQNGVERVFVHCFMDGRDTLPTNGAGYIEQLQQKMREYGIGKIATVSGRYYAMDRDRRWEREKKAFDAMVDGNAEGGRYTDPVQGVKDSYNRGVTDEFVIPFVLTDDRGEPVGTFAMTMSASTSTSAPTARGRSPAAWPRQQLHRAGWARPAGCRRLDAAIPRSEVPKNLHYVCMTEYDNISRCPWWSPPEQLTNILANVMANADAQPARSRDGKYAHVTFFFNGGVEKPFPGEDRVLVQSPKVATYDLKPEMSAQGSPSRGEGHRGQHLRCDGGELRQRRHGRTLRQDSADHYARSRPSTAVWARIYTAVRQHGGAMIVTADHGNAEQMIDPVTGGPQTAHTTNPVPFIVAAEHAVTIPNIKGDPRRFTLRPDGALQDIAPTMLGILGSRSPRK